MDQNMACPRCDEPVTMIIKNAFSPAKYFHARNNQEDYFHEDFTADMKVTPVEDEDPIINQFERGTENG